MKQVLTFARNDPQALARRCSIGAQEADVDEQQGRHDGQDEAQSQQATLHATRRPSEHGLRQVPHVRHLASIRTRLLWPSRRSDATRVHPPQPATAPTADKPVVGSAEFRGNGWVPPRTDVSSNKHPPGRERLGVPGAQLKSKALGMSTGVACDRPQVRSTGCGPANGRSALELGRPPNLPAPTLAADPSFEVPEPSGAAFRGLTNRLRDQNQRQDNGRSSESERQAPFLCPNQADRTSGRPGTIPIIDLL